ncbi:MAG TPA: hypothetical protein VGH03_05515 [Caulobacteraceae bacterium]|jgi:hypothetical protein
MGREADWPPTIFPSQGRRGSVVRLVLIADRIEEATDFALSGPGATVWRIAGTGQGRLEGMVAIEGDAPLGWRDIEVVLNGRLRRLPRAFEVVGPAGYGGGGLGIGSHLI